MPGKEHLLAMGAPFAQEVSCELPCYVAKTLRYLTTNQQKHLVGNPLDTFVGSAVIYYFLTRIGVCGGAQAFEDTIAPS